ncbi:MAG: helix-turn-helix domain-containing protein [Chlorobiota bacterium]|nr:MAG: helix-turn-helix domain-containing protein [Chlorobiota bacterium]
MRNSSQVYGMMDFDESRSSQARAKLIGANLRALRRKVGKTLAEVARVAGVSVSHLANAEHGRRMLAGEYLRRVVALYGYSLGVFLSHIERLRTREKTEHSAELCAIEPTPIPLIGQDQREPHLLLLVPTFSADEPEHLLLHLPPGTELWQPHLSLPVRCTVACARGALLVETPQREYLLSESGFLVIPPEVPHRFRNHTTTASSAYIWVERAWL